LHGHHGDVHSPRSKRLEDRRISGRARDASARRFEDEDALGNQAAPRPHPRAVVLACGCSAACGRGKSTRRSRRGTPRYARGSMTATVHSIESGRPLSSDALPSPAEASPPEPGKQRWCIVGGGMLGLALAHKLAAPDREITVLE